MFVKKNPWYVDSYGPEKELRQFFLELLNKCLGMKSGSGYAPKNIDTSFMCNDRRPFINAFNKAKSKNNNVFTNKIIGDFLELIVRYSKIEEAKNIIETSKFQKAIQQSDYKLEKIDTCENIKEEKSGINKYGRCIEKIINGESFNSECEGCPIKWIYSTLQNIESNYWNIISIDQTIPQEYLNQSKKELVNCIFNDIQKFESNFNTDICNEETTGNLFNSCIRCYEIQDVADEKLAYVKWYTAHICNWPFFKSCLFQLKHYDENLIYSLLVSASRIMKVCETNNWEFLSNIETEKIISYISLAYQNPFAMEYCERYSDIILNCERILSFAVPDDIMLSIYIEMWNLSMHSLKTLYAEKYRIKIEEILDAKSDSSIVKQELTAKYYTYQYMYNLKDRTSVEHILSKTAMYLRKRQVISDTIDIASELFLNTESKKSNMYSQNQNPYITIKAVKGFGVTEELLKQLPDCPSRYKRVFGDNSLLDYLERYRN